MAVAGLCSTVGGSPTNSRYTFTRGCRTVAPPGRRHAFLRNRAGWGSCLTGARLFPALGASQVFRQPGVVIPQRDVELFLMDSGAGQVRPVEPGAGQVRPVKQGVGQV